MDTFPNFNKYLADVLSQQTDIREPAEKNLSDCKNQDFTKFICSLIQVIVDESEPAEARKIGAVVFKNTLINATRQEDGDGIWYRIDEQLRGFIKEALLGMLQSESRATLLDASICLGIIAAIEVPDGKWDHFLQNMAQNSTSETFQFRLASVQTMGMMSEFLDEHFDKPLHIEQIGQILHSTICNISAQQVELSQIAIKALQRTIHSTRDNFQNKEQRDFIMNGLFTAIEIDDEQIQRDALQALAEVPYIAYETIGEYIPRIGEATVKFMSSPDAHKQSQSILQFWTHLCQQELSKTKEGLSLNIAQQYKDSLMPIIFQGLVITELDDDQNEVEEALDEMEWSVSRASGSLLIEVVALLGDQVLEQTISFASSQLNGQSWQDHYVGMLALGSVMDGPSAEALARQLAPAYANIFSMWDSSSSSRVRQAVAWLIAQITKFAPALVFSSQTNLSLIMQSGLVHIRQDHIQVKQFVAQAFQSCFERAKENANLSHMIKPFFADSVNAMLECLFNLQTLTSGTMLAFSNSITSTIEEYDREELTEPLRSICENVYKQISDHLQNPQLMQELNIDQREVFINNWCSVLQPCIVRLGNAQINDQMLTALVDMTIQVFQQFQKVMAGGLFILNGLIATIEKRIEPHLHKLIDYLVCSLKMENCDAMSTRLAAGLISDLSNSVQGEMVQYLPKVMPCLQAILIDSSFDSEAKLVTIVAFGDIVLAAGPASFAQYLAETQNSLIEASKMSISKGSSPEEIDLLQRLRIALCESYVSILHGLSPDEALQVNNSLDNQNTQVEQFALQMYQYLEALVSNNSLAFPVQLLKPMYELFLDITSIYFIPMAIQFVDSHDTAGQRGLKPGALFQTISDSSLVGFMGLGLSALPAQTEDLAEITERFRNVEALVNKHKEQSAPGAPSFPMNTSSGMMY